MTIVEAPRAVTGGVDTHLDVNVAAALDDIGGLLAVEEFATDAAGHQRLLAWLESFGTVVGVGVEGTGSYGLGLARTLQAAGVAVVEVDRPNRQARRRQGKSDPLDAVEAARAALSGRARGAAKTRDGSVEAIRALAVARRSARATKTRTLNQLRHLGFCAPEPLRQRFQGLSALCLAATRLPCGPAPASTRCSSPPRRPCEPSAAGCRSWTRRRPTSTSSWAPRWRRPPPSCSPSTAWAPTPRPPCWWPPATTPSGFAPRRPGPTCAGGASGGVLGQGGAAPAEPGRRPPGQRGALAHRHGPHALGPRTRAYVARRVEEGRSKAEILRMLKRYIARQVYRHLPRG